MEDIGYTALYDSPLGRIWMVGDGESLTGLFFEGQKYFDSRRWGQAVDCPELPVFEMTRRWLDIFFGGGEPDFVPPLSLNGTVFQRSVWAALQTIPYGRTVSYGELARAVSVRSAQAVGGAVGRNPVSIIVPCHRVIGADGSLTGYAGGLDRKRALLQLEQHSNSPRLF